MRDIQQNKSKKIKKIIAAILFVAVILGICAIKWYRTPIHKYVTTTLCSEDGRQIEVTFDVNWQRYLFAETELFGTITIGERIYKKRPVDVGFWEGLKNKFQKASCRYIFVNNQTANLSEWNWLYLEQANSNDNTMNFELVCICLIDAEESRGTYYYGPAGTAEEAKEVSGKIFDMPGE